MLFMRIISSVPFLRPLLFGNEPAEEEQDPAQDMHAALLSRVYALAEDASLSFNQESTLHQSGWMRPRSRWNWLPIGRSKVQIAWLELRNPLWIGNNGIILREYDGLIGESYFMEAEIHLRDINGLKRIQYALETYIANTSIPSQ